MWKAVKILVFMLSSGMFVFIVTMLILAELGSRYHGNYEHYGRYSVLGWGSALIGFLAPGIAIWYMDRRVSEKARKIVGTLALMVTSGTIAFLVMVFLLMEFEGNIHGNSIKAALYLGAYSLAFIAFLAPGIIDWYLRKRGVSKQRPVVRWLSHLTCPLSVVTAIVVAFPRLIGSDDKPAYALAIAFLGLAVVFGISIYAGGSKSRPGKLR